MIVGQLEIELAANIARLSADMKKAQGVVDQGASAMARAANLAKMALGAMAGALSVGAFASFIKGAADASAGLHDLSIQTGASVASLMAFQSIAATTDTTIDDIGGAMNRFAKGMAAADEESKGIGRAVQSIGLDFDTLKAMAPEQQMLAIARALDRFENGAFKASVAMTFYGREGAAMLPYLGDLADQSGEVTAMLTAQEIATQKAAAALADDFGDNLAKINKLGAEWARDMSNGMMPALVAVTGEILKAAEGASGFAAAMREASADGSVAAWTRELIDGMKRVIAAIEPAAKIAAVYFGLFVAAPALIAATVAAMTPLIHAMAVYAMNVAIGQANTIGFNTALFGTSVSAQLAAGSLTKLGLAANVLFAAFAGWQIGTYLDEQFIQARVAGEVFAGALLEIWEHIKLAGKLAFEAATFTAREAITGLMKLSADWFDTMAAGVRNLGFNEKAGQIEQFSTRLRGAAAAQGTFASRTAEARAEHEKSIKVIGIVTQSRIDAAMKEAVLSEATRGTATASASAATEVANLSDEQKRAIKTADDFIKAQQQELEGIGKTEDQLRMLTAARAASVAPEKAQREAIMANALAITIEAKAWKDAEAAREAAENAATEDDRVLLDLQKRARGLEQEIALYGKTAEAAVNAEAAKVRATAGSLAISEEYRQQLIRQAEELERIAKLQGRKDLQDSEKKANEERLAQQKQIWGDIERTAHDTFISIFDSGKSAFDRLKDTLKNGLFELLYQMSIKKWIMNISASTSSSGAGAVGGSGSSLLSSLGSMFGGSSGGAGAAAGSSSGMLGAVGSYGGWIAAGMAIADGLFKKGWDPSNGSIQKKDMLHPLVGESLLFNKIFKAFGLNDRMANLFSGASIVSRLFGRKNPEIESRGFQGTVSAGGFDGNAYANILEKGGVFRSDKRYVQTAALGAEQDAGLDATVKAMIEATRGFAEVLGIEASVIDGYNKTIKLQLGDDEAKNQEAIAKLFGEVGDELSMRLVPSLTEFTKAGETASGTLQRLVADYAIVDEALTAIGMTFGAVGVQSLGARERLIEAAGGVEAFVASTAGFQQNFLSEAERNAPVLKAVTEQLAAMGLGWVDTREELKQVVLGLDLTTEAGAQQYGALMKLQAGFAQVYPATEAVAAALAEQAEAARLAAEAQLQAAGAARAAAIQARKDMANNLLSGVDGMFSALQTVVGREKALLQETANAHRDLSSALHSALDSMGAASQGLDDRKAGQAQIREALAMAKATGALPSADSLKGALSAVSKDAAGMFATQQDYLRDLYTTQNEVAALAGLADEALGVDEQSLKVLDGILASAQQQVAALGGLDTSVLSLAEIMRGLDLAVGAAKADPVASAGGSIAGLYKDLLGRPADSAGLDYWKDQVAGGMSLAEVADLIKQGSEFKGLRGFAVGTNLVPYDMPAMIHQGERIIPAADNRDLMRRLSSPSENSATLAAAVERLTREVEGLRVEARATATHTEKSARLLGRVIKEDTLSVSMEAE